MSSNVAALATRTNPATIYTLPNEYGGSAPVDTEKNFYVNFRLRNVSGGALTLDDYGVSVRDTGSGTHLFRLAIGSGVTLQPSQDTPLFDVRGYITDDRLSGGAATQFRAEVQVKRNGAWEDVGGAGSFATFTVHPRPGLQDGMFVKRPRSVLSSDASVYRHQAGKRWEGTQSGFDGLFPGWTEEVYVFPSATVNGLGVPAVPVHDATVPRIVGRNLLYRPDTGAEVFIIEPDPANPSPPLRSRRFENEAAFYAYGYSSLVLATEPLVVTATQAAWLQASGRYPVGSPIGAPSATATASASPSPTRTATRIPTATPAAVPTVTVTSSVTQRPSATPTVTPPQPLPTSTATHTARPTGTPVPPAGACVWVTNFDSANVFVIDAETETTVGGPIPVGPLPRGIAMTTDGQHAFIANSTTPGTVTVIDTSAGAAVGTPIPVGNAPYGVATSQSGRVYVANAGSNTVSVIDAGTRTVMTTVSVGSGPQVVTITPNDAFAYVANSGSNSVSVIDTTTHAVVATVPVGQSPRGIAMTRRPGDPVFAYVTGQLSDNVTRIDTATHAVVGSPWPAGRFPAAIALNPQQSVVYVANLSGAALTRLDSLNGSTLGTFDLGSTASGILAVNTAQGGRAFVTRTSSHDVVVLNTDTNQVAGAPIPVGRAPLDLAVAATSCPVLVPTSTSTAGASTPTPSAPATATGTAPASASRTPTQTPTSTTPLTATATRTPTGTPTRTTASGGATASPSPSPTPTPLGSAVVLDVPDVSGVPGSTAWVPLVLPAGTGVLSLEATLLYDVTAAQATSVRTTPLSAGCSLADNIGTPSEVRLTIACTDPIDQTGTVAEIALALTSVCGTTALDLTTCRLDEGGVPCLPDDGTLAAGCGIGGRTRYYAGDRPVADVEVPLSGPTTHSMLTGLDGAYHFASLEPAQWTIEPRKTGGHNGGVSALDASYVLQAVVGKRVLDAYQRLACDVTGNGDVSALDASRILQLIVGRIDSLPVATLCASDWAAVPVPDPVLGTQIVDPPVIGGGTCRPGRITLEALAGPAVNQDFLAVLFGDCTGNWQPMAGGAAATDDAGSGGVSLGPFRPGARGTARQAVLLAPERPLQALELEVGFDPRLVDVGDVRLADAAAGNLLAWNVDVPGRLMIAVALLEPVAEPGPLAVVEWRLARRASREVSPMLLRAVPQN